MRAKKPLPVPLDFAPARASAHRPLRQRMVAALGLCVSLMHAHGAGVKAGPFEIEFRHERRMGSLPNADPFKSHRIARYKVLHDGRSVSFNPGGIDPMKRTTILRHASSFWTAWPGSRAICKPSTPDRKKPRWVATSAAAEP